MRAIGAAVGLVAMLGVQAPGRAQPADAFARVALLAGSDDARDLEAALTERLSHLGLRVRVFHVGSPASVEDRPVGEGRERARIWIDMQSSPDVVLRVATVRKETLERPAERRIPRLDSHALMVEQISEIAYDTLESLLAGEPHAATSSVSGPPSTHPPPGPPRPRGRGADFALAAHAFASERGISNGARAVAGGGGAVELSVGRRAGHPSLWLSGALNSSFDAHVAGLTLETSVSSLRAVPSVELFEQSCMRLDAGIGGGVDLLRTIPRDVRSSPYPFDATRIAADTVATGQIVVRTAVPSGAGLMLAGDVDYDPMPHRYVAPPSPGISNRTFQPWSVRPAVMLGLCVPLSGERACASGP